MIHRRLLLALGVAVLVVGLPAAAQIKTGPAPAGEPKTVAATAIQEADHPCGRVLDAYRLQDGSIKAVCSNRETYRVFVVQGMTVAMKCSAAAQLGVSGC
jgi:hypothetical protein